MQFHSRHNLIRKCFFPHIYRDHFHLFMLRWSIQLDNKKVSKCRIVQFTYRIYIYTMLYEIYLLCLLTFDSRFVIIWRDFFILHSKRNEINKNLEKIVLFDFLFKAFSINKIQRFFFYDLSLFVVKGFIEVLIYNHVNYVYRYIELK